MIGETIAHYKIERRIGAGGMGEVFLATDTKLDRQVALKFLPPGLAQNPEARERLRREAKAASRLNHSNIVTIFSVEEHDDRDFIVMEYVEGRSLDLYLKEQPRTTGEILRIAGHIARALEHAHASGIIHRDLKPGNILIDGNDRAKICDFGLARLPGTTQITKTGLTLGTVAYMSPEHLQGKKADAKSDIFSFGVILYEMIAGRLPFQGDHEAALMYSVANEEPDPLERYKSDLSPAVSAIVARALEKDPKTRYQTAADLQADIRRERKLRDSGASRISGSTTAIAVPRKRSLARIIVPSSLAIAAIVLLLIFKPWRVDIQPMQEAAAADDRIAVMYFDNLADPNDDGRRGEIVASLLISDLAESQFLQVVSSQRLYDILKLLGKEGARVITPDVATQVARKAKARWMVTGKILETEPSWVVTAQLVEVSTGNVLASPTVTGAQGERVYAIVDRLTSGIRGNESLPDAVRDEADPQIIELTTPSEEAYRLYLEGRDLERQFMNAEAGDRFRAAVEIDSTFAMAYFWLSQTRFSLGNDFAGALQAIKQAVRFKDRASEIDQLLIEAVAAAMDGEFAAARAALDKAVIRDPENKLALYCTAVFAEQFGGPDSIPSAIAFYRRMLEIDPLDAMAYNQLAYCYEQVGDFEQSLWAINKYIELVPDEPNPYDTRADLYAFNGQIDKALGSYLDALEVEHRFRSGILGASHMYMYREQYDSAHALAQHLVDHVDPDLQASGYQQVGNIMTHRGHFREALNQRQAHIDRERARAGGLSRATWGYVTKAALLMTLGEYDLALADVDSALAFVHRYMNDHPGIVGGIGSLQASILAQAGRFEEADSAVAQIAKSIRGSTHTDSAGYFGARGRVELYRGNYDTAIVYMTKEIGGSPSFMGQLFLGRAYAGQRKFRDAIQMYESALNRYDKNRRLAPALSVLIHYYLGLAYERSGRTSDAVAQYERFLHIWRDADTEIEEIVDARERLAQLQS